MRKKFKQLCSGLLSAVMTLSAIPLSAIHAEDESSRYPYAFFAGSSAEGAITISADNVCINGNIATNGTMVTSAANFNVNGEIIENAAETMIQCFQKIDDAYFSSSAAETYSENYFLEDTNINVDTPIETDGDIELIGNINISSGLKALNDIRMSGNVENTQNSAIYSQTGDIIIDTENVNLNGIVYAPNGNVNISATNLNINSVVIIADTITISCPNMNANYSTLAGELIGRESEGNTEIVPVLDFGLTAYGEYNADKNSVEIYWNTTIPQGTFDIQISDDGENYSSVAEITDEYSYEYIISEPFSQKYIKVIETVDSSISYSAVPFIVRNTDDGYSAELLDSDEDGLPDIFELKVDTEIDNADTDLDGLTDYQELVIVGTDPTKYDSAEEGISDAEFDSDGDGLSNIDEVTRTTDPRDLDTDMDGLSDYDEIFVYDTDPLVADSDNDGIDDGSEIKLGLDPNSAATHGVPDGEYKMDQAIGTDNGILSSINTEESPYSLSIEMKTNGDIEKEINIVNSGYSNVIENDAMIGAGLDISMSDTCDPEDIVLKYDIKPEFTVNTLDKYSALPEFQGIKRLNIFKFNEEENMLLPIETKFSDNGTQLYAEVNELGTYCVMDMEIWLDNLGVDMTENDVNMSSLQASYPSSTKIMADEKQSQPLTLVFFLQYESGSDCYAWFDSEKKLIKQLSRYAFANYNNVKVYVIKYGYEKAEPILVLNNKPYFSNYINLETVVSELELDTSRGFSNREKPADYLVNNFIISSDNNIFAFNLINGATYGDIKYDKKNYSLNNVNYSYVTPISDYFQYDSKMQEMISENQGLYLQISDNNFITIVEHIESHLSKTAETQDETEYNIILPTNWQTITLNAPLVKDGKTNSDEDSLTDWEEIEQTKVSIGENGKVIPPEFNIADLLSYTNRYKGIEYDLLLKKAISHIPYLPIISDPTDEDTDDDGLLDDEDHEPQKVFLNDLIINLKLMEQYIDDYYKSQYLKDLQNHEYPRIDENSIVAVNILRDLFYGTGHDTDIKDIKEYLNNERHIVQWWLADGSAFPLVRRYIEKQNTSILPYFRQYKLYDKEGNYIDFLHMLTVLAAERHGDIFHDPNLAGWAGDLQSSIKDLRYLSNQYNNRHIEEVFYEASIGKISFDDQKLTYSDILADIDAKNIAVIYSPKLLLSDALNKYYNNNTNYRFTDFVNYYGNITSFNTIVESYTKGYHPVKHVILHWFGRGKIENEESIIMTSVFLRIVSEGVWNEIENN